MGQTSIGSPNASDGNENHPKDDKPSKTFGAEGGGKNATAPDAAPEGSGKPNQADDSGKLRFDAEGKPSGAAAAALPGEPLDSAPSDGVPVNPDAYPDGPNIEASPWELEAARGKTKLKP